MLCINLLLRYFANKNGIKILFSINKRDTYTNHNIYLKCELGNMRSFKIVVEMELSFITSNSERISDVNELLIITNWKLSQAIRMCLCIQQ